MGLGANMADARACPREGGGQARLRALERLALRFLVAAQHQRLLRWVEIKPDHVPELLFKLLVVRQFEGAREVRLDVVGAHSRCTLDAEMPAARASCGNSTARDAAAAPLAPKRAGPPLPPATVCGHVPAHRSIPPAG